MIEDRFHLWEVSPPGRAGRPGSKRASVTSSVKPGDFDFPSVTTGYICHAWKGGLDSCTPRLSRLYAWRKMRAKMLSSFEKRPENQARQAWRHRTLHEETEVTEKDRIMAGQNHAWNGSADSRSLAQISAGWKRLPGRRSKLVKIGQTRRAVADQRRRKVNTEAQREAEESRWIGTSLRSGGVGG